MNNNLNDKTIAKALGLVIRKERENLKLSQEDFAELTGHHRTYVGMLERGERSPNVVTLQLIAEALKMNASDLLREAGY